MTTLPLGSRVRTRAVGICCGLLSAALFCACADTTDSDDAAATADIATGAGGDTAGGGDPLPTVTLLANGGASSVTGLVKLVATATDDVGVTHVQFLLDGELLVDDTAFPFQHEWSSTSAPEGTHKLAAVAYDTAGGSATAEIEVMVDRALPTVALASPTEGAVVEGEVTLTATSTDNNALERVDFEVASGAEAASLIGSAAASPFEVVWETAGLASGEYTLTVIAVDAAGNKAVVTRIVQLDRAPTVVFDAPTTGAIVSGAVTVKASAKDDIGIQSGEILLDGVSQSATAEVGTDIAWVWAWDAAAAEPGAHKIKAIVKDSAGTEATVEIDVTVVQPISVGLFICPDSSYTGCSLQANSQVSGTVYLQAKILSGSFEPTAMTLAVDGEFHSEVKALPWNFMWDSKLVEDGAHTLQVSFAGPKETVKSAVLVAAVDNCDVDQDGEPSMACGGKDCNDTVATIGPSAEDKFGDGFDKNCDGLDGVDADGDGYASVTSGGDDCDDANKLVHPCADDVAGDGLDANCDTKDELSCDDCVICSVDTADAGVCKHTAANEGGACDDGDACNKADACVGGACVGSGATDCDDGIACTVDSCDAGKGCVYVGDNTPCADSEPCLADICEPGKGCTHPPASSATACPDGMCDAKGGCVKVAAPPPGMSFIPGGTFQMGCVPGDGSCYANESPRHTVTVDAFYMDQMELTVGAFKKCVAAGVCAVPSDKWGPVVNVACNFPKTGKDDHPINCVDWVSADAYCKWVGLRLPSEAEWEYAARGGLDGKLYPWGDVATEEFAVYSSNSTGLDFTEFMNGKEGSNPVGSKPAGVNSFGLFDMSGNLCEWVNDWYASDYYESSPTENPKGPTTGTYRANRGGFYKYPAEGLRASLRFHDVPTQFFDGLGFRCAKSID